MPLLFFVHARRHSSRVISRLRAGVRTAERLNRRCWIISKNILMLFFLRVDINDANVYIGPVSFENPAAYDVVKIGFME